MSVVPGQLKLPRWAGTVPHEQGRRLGGPCTAPNGSWNGNVLSIGALRLPLPPVFLAGSYCSCRCPGPRASSSWRRRRCAPSPQAHRGGLSRSPRQAPGGRVAAVFRGDGHVNQQLTEALPCCGASIHCKHELRGLIPSGGMVPCPLVGLRHCWHAPLAVTGGGGEVRAAPAAGGVHLDLLLRHLRANNHDVHSAGKNSCRVPLRLWICRAAALGRPAASDAAAPNGLPACRARAWTPAWAPSTWRRPQWGPSTQWQAGGGRAAGLGQVEWAAR